MTTSAEKSPNLTEVPTGERDKCLLCREPLQMFRCNYNGSAPYEQYYSAADIANGNIFVGCTHEVW